MENIIHPARAAVLLLILVLSGGSVLSAQSISFQYGSIPFGESADRILSRAGNAEVDRSQPPTTQFLSSDVIIRKNLENPVYRFFDGGILKTVSWGDAYVELYSNMVRRIDLRLPDETKAKLYFFEDKLFLLHKAARLENRYKEAFSSLLPALTNRIGSEPFTGDTRFRGFSYQLYSKYAFWEEEEVSIFVLVREKGFQSKVSTAEYVYIDTGLWEQYKNATRVDERNTKDLLGDF